MFQHFHSVHSRYLFDAPTSEGNYDVYTKRHLRTLEYTQQCVVRCTRWMVSTIYCRALRSVTRRHNPETRTLYRSWKSPPYKSSARLRPEDSGSQGASNLRWRPGGHVSCWNESCSRITGLGIPTTPQFIGPPKVVMGLPGNERDFPGTPTLCFSLPKR